MWLRLSKKVASPSISSSSMTLMATWSRSATVKISRFFHFLHALWSRHLKPVRASHRHRLCMVGFFLSCCLDLLIPHMSMYIPSWILTFTGKSNCREAKLGAAMLCRSCLRDDGQLGGGHDGHFNMKNQSMGGSAKFCAACRIVLY